MYSSKSTSSVMLRDSVLVPIEYIRVANLLFIDRDRVTSELNNCKKARSITKVVIKTSDNITSKLEAKVANLECIINTNNKINSLEVDKLCVKLKHEKRSKLVIITGSSIILLLVILL